MQNLAGILFLLEYGKKWYEMSQKIGLTIRWKSRQRMLSAKYLATKTDAYHFSPLDAMSSPATVAKVLCSVMNALIFLPTTSTLTLTGSCLEGSSQHKSIQPLSYSENGAGKMGR